MGIPAALLGLGAFAALSGLFDSSDDPEGETPDEVNETPETPEEEGAQDTGATVTTLEHGTVQVELGEDETGSLLSLIYLDSEDTGESSNFYTEFETRIYLAPEGTDLSQKASASSSGIPGYDAFVAGNGTGAYDLAALEETLGLELIHTIDLLPLMPDAQPTYPALIDLGLDALDQVEANAPTKSYFLEAVTDGDDLSLFLPEDYVPTYNGVAATAVTDNVTGGEETDWFAVEEGAPTALVVETRGGDDLVTTKVDDTGIRAGDGDDLVIAYSNGNSVSGGAGNDTINASGHDMVITGDAGADQIHAYGSGQAMGGEGNDTVYAGNDQDHSSWTNRWDTFETVLEPGLPLDVDGGAGHDRIIVSGVNATGYGGEGDDFLSVENGARGHGGVGNDHLQLSAGSMVFGEDGDDLFTMYEFQNAPESAVATGGDGADTYSLAIRGANAPDPESYLRITDFDPSEDALEVELWNRDSETIDSVTLSEASDGSHTDVLVNVSSIYAQSPGSVIIRLDGVTGMSPDAVVIRT
ncbi:calcium-binding protein [Ruegeria aquimaris]|uniref:Uncharacterized protein n=1 Tax=Ruegeria aquimaris TaxID=2984333 RepID=A0ABT3AJ33_9RHOB|nr:hypothetical protein [Ruegeria sp. XHP0148]MCV2888700.1 hypothetical protein [Ruegeria sp. XHP0148]